MPAISDAKLKRTKKFKAKDYRAWNINDTASSNTHSEEVQEVSSKNNQEASGIKNETLSEIDTHLVLNWEYHDRPEAELGDIQAFAEEFKKIGQQQPCIVRPHREFSNKFELIIGERRWRAAKLAGLPLKAIIKEMSDADAAMAQAAENEDREGLSEYAKGMSYNRLIENNIIKQKDLIDRLGKSKQYISALLSFAKIPQEIQKAISDFSKVSARTAEEIKQLSSKGNEYIEAIIDLSPRIRAGSIGQKSIRKLVDGKVSSSDANISSTEKFIKNGRHLVTLRKDNNLLGSFHFPKNILNALSDKGITLNDLGDEIANIIENKF